EILKRKIKISKTSSLYETKPMYMENQGWFLNGVAKVETKLKPKKLLEFLKSTEKKMGRKTTERNGPRIIDLDILFYGDQILSDDDLHVPHPKLHERAFVLVPLAEVEPTLIHPVCRKSILELLSELKYDRSEIKLKNHD
ncbi:MAG TPA: 2-amino-4-hydroxy-6-hydroxymethyldihydropteridine diphosphokinase, partial [Candidatus Binatia bacterium]|nr:2-amino-4-hydroxy-6-hydroxymethyldihydropteridine diphosphokinase [Candidatus Binatia bacterium]